MWGVPRLLSYTVAFALHLRKNAGKRHSGQQKSASWAFVLSIGQTELPRQTAAIQTLGLRLGWVRLILGQPKHLPSCRTKGFPTSANIESKLSVRALM